MARKSKQKAASGMTAKAGEIYEFLEQGIPDGYHHVYWEDAGVVMHNLLPGSRVRLYHPDEVIALQDIGFFWADGAGSFPPQIPFEHVFRAWRRYQATKRDKTGCRQLTGAQRATPAQVRQTQLMPYVSALADVEFDHRITPNRKIIP